MPDSEPKAAQPFEFAERYGPWAVVTGAAQGVGLAFAAEILRRGVSVVLVDRNPSVVQTAEGLADSLETDSLETEVTTRSVVADLADPGWLDLVADATADVEVGLAVANAGISFVGHFLDMTAAQRHALIAVNATATADMAAWALPDMVERGRGGLLVTSSGSALAGTAGVSLYSATKAFILNLSEAIGWELRNTGVDTLAFCGPSMDTPAFNDHNFDATRMFVPPVDPAEVVPSVLDQLPVGGAWIPEGMELILDLPRAQQVDTMSATTTGMYPSVFE